MIGKRYILLLFIALIPLAMSGQIIPQPGGAEDEEQLSAQQPERNVASRVVSWMVVDNGAFIDSVKIDTLNKFFHNYHPVFKNTITNTYTGNYGGAYLNNDFFMRDFSTGFYFARSHDAYILIPEKLDFYNTTTPYTMLDYSQSENQSRQNETRFNVLHSQNINRNLNFTFRFDQAKSDGQYNYQNNNNNSITLYTSYNSERANFYGGFISNRIRNQENGGMIDDTQLLKIEKQEFISMWLSDARSELRSTYIFANGEYKLGTTTVIDEIKYFRPIASAIYSFKLSNNRRNFWEGERSDNSGFFADFYLNPEFTHDSTHFRSIENHFQLLFHETAQKKFSFGQRAFIGANIVRQVFAAPGYDSPVFPFHPGAFERHLYVGPDRRWNKSAYTNVYIGGGIFRHLGDFWTWDIVGKQYVTGYLAGQTELLGKISKPVLFWSDSLASINIGGELTNRVPDYFQNEYFSNRIKWENNFVNEQIMNAAFTFYSPLRKLEVSARYSLINNFIYHNNAGIPSQTRREQLILSAFMNKDFTSGNFGLKAQVLWQKASAPQYIRLPDLSVRLVPYYDMIISKVLFTQIGIDVRFNTEYYADAYDPATGFFYLQDEKKLGSYPYMDAFANLKLKRTRVFFQFMNIGSQFLNRPYFTTLNHPMNKMTFRLGVAWSFYN
jgi:hypothetical protein